METQNRTEECVAKEAQTTKVQESEESSSRGKVGGRGFAEGRV